MHSRRSIALHPFSHLPLQHSSSHFPPSPGTSSNHDSTSQYIQVTGRYSSQRRLAYTYRVSAPHTVSEGQSTCLRSATSHQICEGCAPASCLKVGWDTHSPHCPVVSEKAQDERVKIFNTSGLVSAPTTPPPPKAQPTLTRRHQNSTTTPRGIGSGIEGVINGDGSKRGLIRD